MEDKKNVGFVPGLALILAALALVLISINAVKPTPTVEELEKSIDKRFAALNDSIASSIKNSNVVDQKVSHALFMRDLDDLMENLAEMKASNTNGVAAELDAIGKQLEGLKAKMNGKAKPAEKKEAKKEAAPL